MRAASRARWAVGLAFASFFAPAAISAALPAAASAAVTASAITSPANDAEYFVDQPQSTSTAAAFTVAGTVSGTGDIDIDCVTSTGSKTLAAAVVPSGGAFSVAITEQKLYSVAKNTQINPCVLRAVPAGGTPAGPGVTSPYTGPDIAIGSSTFYGTDGTPQNTQSLDYYTNLISIAGSGTTGILGFDSDAGCGITHSQLVVNTPALASSAPLFDCNGEIVPPYVIENSTKNTPNGIDVDGHDGALPDSYGTDITAFPGWKPVVITDTFANGELTIQDNEPVMLCVPACGEGGQQEPTAVGVTGVELDRTWQTEDNGLVALQTDVFRSTDGAAHTVVVDYDQNFSIHGGGSVDFPGSSGFAAPVVSQSATLPSGTTAIYLKSDAQTPDSGDGTNPQGAIVAARAPSGPAVVTYTATGTFGRDDFYLPYTLQVPAGGTAALRFAYVQDFALADVKALTQQALTGFDPSLTLSSPGNNSTSSSPEVTVSGTAGDVAGIKSVTINGAPELVGSGGAFSDTVDLPVGSNTVSVTATDADGLTTTQTAAVTVAMQSTTSLGTKITIGRKRHNRRTYKLSGALRLPAGVLAAQGCSGKITVTAKRGRKKVGSASATLSAACTWSAKFTAKRLKGRGKLNVTVAFGGNASVKPFTPKALRPKY